MTVNSPVSAPQWPSPIWDPYQVAARPAMFTGTITSTSGQYLLPQPMPRVPYYTQQPVAAAGAGQPYVVIPDPGCAAPVVSSAPLATSAPFVVPPAAAPIPSSTVVMPGPMPPAIAAPATVPVLTNPIFAPPPIYASSCYFDADAIFFTRDARIGNTPLVLLDMNASTQSNVLLSTADLNFNYEVGPRILIGHAFDPYNAFEASYFGIYNWQATATVNGDNNLNLAGRFGRRQSAGFYRRRPGATDLRLGHSQRRTELRAHVRQSFLAGRLSVFQLAGAICALVFRQSKRYRLVPHQRLQQFVRRANRRPRAGKLLRQFLVRPDRQSGRVRQRDSRIAKRDRLRAISTPSATPAPTAGRCRSSATSA